MLRKKKKYVLYPEYFDKSRTRRQGRRVPLSEAVDEISLKKILTAAKLAELNPVEEPDKSFSKSWHEHNGRILVDKIGTKTEVLLKVARIARKLKKKTPTTAMSTQKKPGKKGRTSSVYKPRVKPGKPGKPSKPKKKST